MDEIQPPRAAPPATGGRSTMVWKLGGVAAVYWLGLALVTHWPGSAFPRFRIPFVSADKLIHFSIFAGLSVLLTALATTVWKPTWTARLGVVAVLALYAALDEATQTFVPLREPSVKDWVADVAGALAGATFYAIVSWRSVAPRDIPSRDLS